MANEKSEQTQALHAGFDQLIEKGLLAEAKSIIDMYRRGVGILDPEAYVKAADIAYAQEGPEAAARVLKEGLVADCEHSGLSFSLGTLFFSLGHQAFSREYFEDARRCYLRALSGVTREQQSVIAENLLTIERYRQEGVSVESEPGLSPVPSLTHGAGFLDRLLCYMSEHAQQYCPYNYDFDYAALLGWPQGDINTVDTAHERTQILTNLPGLEKLYDLLDNDKSRGLLVELMAYRILGNQRVMLSTNTPEYWMRRSFARALAQSETIETGFRNLRLNYFDLREAGFDTRLFATPSGAFNTFVNQHYAYEDLVRADKGDVVIDCGGCWGDTALYFADQVGPEGSVHTWEFVPSNIEILKKNVQLNPDVVERVTVVEQPVWEKSGIPMYYLDRGPATKVSFEPIGAGTPVDTISIDDYVRQAGLTTVDFIKMDIEGAEMSALRGAVQTLRSFRPKLAISLYHQISDFADVVAYLDGLGLGYSYYLDHTTVFAEETVLFAIRK